MRVGLILSRLIANFLQLEGHELSYLRAIGESFPKRGGSAGEPNVIPGVIILSAVLKRRMMLADKAKSLFISK